jgi:hypothetical protein
VVYKPGKEMYLADTLSRAFPSNLEEVNLQQEFEQINMVNYLPISNDRLSQIRQETLRDETLQLLMDVILKGWTSDKILLPAQVHPYYCYRDELTVQDGLIFRGERVVIPGNLRKTMKERIHSSHLGIEGCLRRARESVYWPNMNADIKDHIQRCEICSEYQTANQKETLMPHDVPDRPWSKIGTDLFSIGEQNFLITVDYTSNFWEVDTLDSTESRAVIKKLKAHFGRYGIPDQVISDNGPQFNSSSFQNFSRDWDFEHLTISPGHSQSNGQVESAVKTAKKLIKKATKANSDIYLAILDHRNTPQQGTMTSPAQILMNRRTKTLLPTAASLLRPTTTYDPTLKRMSKERQKVYYDVKAKDLDPLQEGEVVRMKPHQKGQNEWRKAVVTKRLDERSYDVETENRTYRRNRVELKPVKTPISDTVNSEQMMRTHNKSYNTPSTTTNAISPRKRENRTTDPISSKKDTTDKPTENQEVENTRNQQEESTKTPQKTKPTKEIKTPSPKEVSTTPEKPRPRERRPEKPIIQQTRHGRIIRVPAKYRD